jgi:D-tyrosyl-tRNA(Tyr) deacylase
MVKKRKILCLVNFLTAEDNKVIVKCILQDGASFAMGVNDGDNKSFKVTMIKSTKSDDFQVDITGINDDSFFTYYWEFNEDTANSLVVTPGGDRSTQGYPTLTITPQGDWTKIVRTGGDKVYTILDEVIIMPT